MRVHPPAVNHFFLRLIDTTTDSVMTLAGYRIDVFPDAIILFGVQNGRRFKEAYSRPRHKLAGLQEGRPEEPVTEEHESAPAPQSAEKKAVPHDPSQEYIVRDRYKGGVDMRGLKSHVSMNAAIARNAQQQAQAQARALLRGAPTGFLPDEG